MSGVNAKITNPESPRFGQIGEIRQCDTYHNSDETVSRLYHIRFKDSPHWGVFAEHEVEIDVTTEVVN